MPKSILFKLRLLLILSFLVSSHTWAQINVNATATPDLCVGNVVYSTLGDIVLSEVSTNDFTLTGVNQNITIHPTISSRFEFEPGIGSVLVTGPDASSIIASLNVTATQIELVLSEVDDLHESSLNTITISGIQVRAINTASVTNLERLGGDLIVPNFINGDIITGSTLTSFLPPSSANAGADQTGVNAICGTSTNLTAIAPTVGTGVWSISPLNTGALPYTITDTNDENSSFSGLAGETYILRWTVTNGPCASSFDDVTVQFDESVTSNAGINITSCNTLVNLAATAPTLGSGVWSFVSNPDNLGAISNVNAATSLFSGARGTTYVLRWTVANGVCTAFDDVSVTILNQPTIADAGSDITICGNSTALGANFPVLGTGFWSFSPTPGSNPDNLPLSAFSNVFSNTSNFTGTQGQTYRLRWTINYSTCPSSFDEVLVRLDRNPTPVNAGPDQIICTNTANLSAVLPTVGTGFWNFSPDLGSNPDGLPISAFSDVNSFSSTFTGTPGNTYKLRWTVSNGVCAPVFDEVTIQLDQSPSAAVAGADQQVCGTSTNLAATAPAIGTGVWSFSPANTGTGGNINNPTQTNSSFTGTAGQV